MTTGFDYIPEDSDEMIDCMGGLALMYNGKEVEGTVYNFVKPKEKIFEEVILTIDGKKYKIIAELVE